MSFPNKKDQTFNPIPFLLIKLNLLVTKKYDVFKNPQIFLELL